MSDNNPIELFSQVEKQLENKYFLISKRSFWYFAGGVFAFLVAAFGISYKSILNTINEKTGQMAIENLIRNAHKADSLSTIYSDKLRALEKPVGTIVAFAGPRSSIPNGWLLCDGKNMPVRDFPKLYSSIRNYWGGDGETFFKLPDLRGVFLRGVGYGSLNDPDAIYRKNSAHLMNEVGSYQEGSTAMPQKGFATDTSGEHNHNVLSKGSASIWRLYGEPNYDILYVTMDTRQPETSRTNSGLISNALAKSGKHFHRLIGGDKETRPRNAAVNYIIRVE